MLTDQETFDKAYLGIIRQGRPSYESGKCFYRSSDGAACAAGQLIEDQYYSKAMEGSVILATSFDDDTVGCRSVQEALTKSGVTNFPLVNGLQKAHDEVARGYDDDFITSFKKRAERVADKFGLVVPATPVVPDERDHECASCKS